MKNILVGTLVLTLMLFGPSISDWVFDRMSEPEPEVFNERVQKLINEGYARFREERNPEYIGSYECRRSHLRVFWSEWGEWRSDFELFLDRTAVGFGSDGRCTFSANPGYEWVPVWKYGTVRFQLVKK